MRAATQLALAGILVAAGCASTRPRPATTRPLPAIDVPRALVAPAMAARLDDPAWQRAAVIAGLTVSRGGEAGDARRLPTEARLMWDHQFLYIRFICEDNDIYAPHFKGDVVEVFLDVKGDSMQYIELQVNPNGELYDSLFLLTAPPQSHADGRLIRQVLQRDGWDNPAWNLPGLRVGTGRFGEEPGKSGWIVDIALPAEALLRRLGKKAWEPMDIRSHLLRYDWQPAAGPGSPRQLVAMNWSPVLHGCPHISPRAMGCLRLVDHAMSGAKP